MGRTIPLSGRMYRHNLTVSGASYLPTVPGVCHHSAQGAPDRRGREEG